MEERLTYRERRERRAERLREWADSRAAKADAAQARVHEISDTIPFGQPILVGHHSEGRHRRDLARIDRGMRDTVENAAKADEMRSRAGNIEAAADHAIYSDDVDAADRLEARIAELEAERDRWKAYNASCRRGTPDLTVLDEKQRGTVATVTRVAPYQLGKGGAITYTNLSANITRNRKRLEEVRARSAIVDAGGRGLGRPMLSRYAGACPECGEPIERGAEIIYYRLTREALHAGCVEG